MIRPEHALKVTAKEFNLAVRHRSCGHVMFVTREADSFSSLIVEFSLKCGNCGAVGAHKDWDSLDKSEREQALTYSLTL